MLLHHHTMMGVLWSTHSTLIWAYELLKPQQEGCNISGELTTFSLEKKPEVGITAACHWQATMGERCALQQHYHKS